MIAQDHIIELSEKMAVIAIPENSVEITMRIKVFKGGGELETVERTLDMSAIRAAIQEAEDNYIPDDAVFQVTEKGMKYLEELNANV